MNGFSKDKWVCSNIDRSSSRCYIWVVRKSKPSPHAIVICLEDFVAIQVGVSTAECKKSFVRVAGLPAMLLCTLDWRQWDLTVIVRDQYLWSSQVPVKLLASSGYYCSYRFKIWEWEGLFHRDLRSVHDYVKNTVNAKV